MPEELHGREYLTVEERIVAAHKQGPWHMVEAPTFFEVGKYLLCKVQIVYQGRFYFGTVGCQPGTDHWVENAETSAVGRALQHAGFVKDAATAETGIRAPSGQALPKSKLAPADTTPEKKIPSDADLEKATAHRDIAAAKTRAMLQGKVPEQIQNVRLYARAAGYESQEDFEQLVIQVTGKSPEEIRGGLTTAEWARVRQAIHDVIEGQRHDWDLRNQMEDATPTVPEELTPTP